MSTKHALKYRSIRIGMAPRLVLFPLPMQGHINPMLQLASILHAKGFNISIVCTRCNSPDPTSNPDFNFHIISDGLSETEASTEDVVVLLTTLNKRCVEPFRECLYGIVSPANSFGEEPVTCLITDAFWYFCQDVADDLRLPRLVLQTCNISSFLSFLAFHYINQQGYLSMQDTEAVVPELSPLRIKDLPRMITRDPTLLEELIPGMLRGIKASNGLIFNSFKELESPALAKVQEQLSNIPIFHCGAFHRRFVPHPPSSKGLPASDDSCISWLDKLSPNSVIYISLGTVVSIEKSEFLELAQGIVASNRPFLWVIRPGFVRGSEKLLSTDGFLERGHVVNWAPQREVLAHPAVGGFWTHSGWNSTLESVCEGVPMICLPFFGDQMSNARYVSDVWRIGLYYDQRIEKREVEKAIKRLMVENEGQEMRERASCFKGKARECLEVGGSSHISLESLVDFLHEGVLIR